MREFLGVREVTENRAGTPRAVAIITWLEDGRRHTLGVLDPPFADGTQERITWAQGIMSAYVAPPPPPRTTAAREGLVTAMNAVSLTGIPEPQRTAVGAIVAAVRSYAEGIT